MDKNDKNNIKSSKKAELAALFNDLQDTLNASVISDKADPELKDTRKAAVGVSVKEREETEPANTETGDFSAVFDDIKKDGAAPARNVKKRKDEPKKEELKQQEKQEEADIGYQLLNTLDGVGITPEEPEKREPDAPIRAKKPLNLKSAREKPLKFDGLFRASAKEYASREQNDGIVEAYQSMYIWELSKLVVSALLFLALAYIELAPFLNLGLPEILVHYNTVYILVSTQFFLWAAFAAQKSLIFGFKSILKSEINLYAAVSVFFVFAFVHTAAAYILVGPGTHFVFAHTVADPDAQTQIMLFNSVAALAMLGVSVYNILDIRFEASGFRAAMSKKIKYAFRLDNNAPEERELFRNIIPQDTPVGQIFKTTFVSNFFSRTGSYKNHGESVRFYIYISFAAAIAIALACSIIMNRDIYRSLSAAVFMFLGSVPLCSLVSKAYPIFRAQKKAQAHGAAFVGVDSAEEYSDIAILSLSDKDIFPPSTVRLAPGVKVFRNNRLDTVLYYLCSLFSALNLPASEEFKEIVEWDANKAAEAGIKIIDIQDNGISYETHGVRLFAGKSEYIENLGLRAPVDPDFDDQFLRSSGVIMLLASENEVIAKIYLKYELTANFHDILKNIRRMNSCVCIKTFDPNIDEALLHRLVGTSRNRRGPIKVLKLTEPHGIYRVEEKAETGIISKDSLKSIVSTLVIANRAKTAIKTNAFIRTVAFCLSLIVTALIVLIGPADINHAGILLLIQLFWTGTLILLSALSS